MESPVHQPTVISAMVRQARIARAITCRWSLMLPTMLVVLVVNAIVAGDDHGSLRYHGYVMPYGSGSACGIHGVRSSFVTGELLSVAFAVGPSETTVEAGWTLPGDLVVTFQRSDSTMERVENEIIRAHGGNGAQAGGLHPLRSWTLNERAAFEPIAEIAGTDVKGRRLQFSREFRDSFSLFKSILTIYLLPDRAAQGTVIIEEHGFAPHPRRGHLFKKIYSEPVAGK